MAQARRLAPEEAPRDCKNIAKIRSQVETAKPSKMRTVLIKINDFSWQKEEKMNQKLTQNKENRDNMEKEENRKNRVA